jgi:hypothetical protein
MEIFSDNFKRYTFSLVGVGFFFLSLTSLAHAADVAGTWKYEKTVDPLFDAKSIPGPTQKYIRFIGNDVWLSNRCFGAVRNDDFGFSSSFQLLLKNGFDEGSISQYLKKNAAVDLDRNSRYYKANLGESTCTSQFKRAIVAGDSMLVPVGGTGYRKFVRLNGGAAGTEAGSSMLAGHISSQLPFDVEIYNTLCAKYVAGKNSVPQTTNKCAPIYYPYVAMADSPNKLAKIIGNHNYEKGGANFSQDYSPPFAHKLHPVYMVLPPLKDVTLVRVEDHEPGQNENRDVMSGVYLAIKDGKVSDQINDGCSIDESYACVNDEGKKVYQLQESGKFKRFE